MDNVEIPPAGSHSFIYALSTENEPRGARETFKSNQCDR